MQDSKHPLLDALIIKRKIWFDDNGQEFVGLASDGVIVSLGYDEMSIENYLFHCPTPDKW